MRRRLLLGAANAAVLAGALLAAVSLEPPGTAAAGAPAAASPVQAAPDRVEPTPVATPAAVATPAPAPTTQPPAPSPSPVPRSVSATGWAPYATVGPVVLHAPGDVVEVIGFHQSGHDGAQPQSPVEGPPARAGLLESRERDTHPQGAADVVVDPAREVRSPVTGTVLRAGTYTLYCDHVDQFLVVEPDARPGWEVKLLHVEGLSVARGDRVEAGVTVVAANARLLPFASQVDDHTAAPHWPHVHVEVVDPSVPDRPSGGGCD